jgi:nicotinate phosphoribosyltransferase
MSRLSPFERDVVYARGKTKLWEKLEILKSYPEVIFSDFGTRRRFSRFWHDYVISVLKQEMKPEQFRGTSNVYLAMKHGLMPMGTSAHEMFMAMACIVPDTYEDIRSSPEKVLDLWERHYGEGLRIILPDTFGTRSFLDNMGGPRLATWRGFRQDSGDPFQFGEMVLHFYERFGVDARQKMIIFSDGLEVPVMMKLAEHFKGRINVSFGWGTNLTNDLGFKPLSLVVKLVQANGRGTVKLSDNLAKAMGAPGDIEYYKTIFGYTGTLDQTCKY